MMEQSSGVHNGAPSSCDGTPMESEIGEEMPTMRAVTRHGPGPTLLRGNHDGNQFMGKMGGLGLSRPPVGLKSRASSTHGPALEVKDEWTGITSAFPSWNVNGSSLEMVPVDYPLERTHREIADTDASVVASRISEVLASMSIESEFDCRNAKAKCKTGDYVGFRIRLYAASESGQPVVVEVQRRCGSVSSFMDTCRAILSAAEGKKMPNPSQRLTRIPLCSVGDLACLKSVYGKENTVEEEASNAIDGVIKMLRSHQSDLNLLGIENLVNLTDPIKTCYSVALLVSKSIILGSDKHDIREEIRLITERDVFGPGPDDRDGSIISLKDKFRHFALMVLANSMDMCAKDGCLASAAESQSWFVDHLLPSLCDELRRASTDVTNAYQATCSLNHLLFSSETACQSFLKNDHVKILQMARVFGVERHVLLASETERCLKYLESRYVNL